MPNRRTRDRQLAKLAARRASERAKRRRQRILAAAVGIAVAAGGIGVGIAFLLRGTPKATAAKSSPSPSASAGGVACGATTPAAAATKKPQFKKAPPVTIDPKKTYTATMKTSCGTIVLRLDPADAPMAVNSFVFLARKRFFDGLTFHRVVKDFVIQGGDPTGTGSGGPGYSFKDELKNSLKYEVGTLAMANSGANTNGSQFFIVAGSQASTLQKNYTIFGKVLQGLDVVTRIDDLPTDSQTQKPLQTVYIESVRIIVS